MKKLAGIALGILVSAVWGCNAPETPKFGVVDVAKVIDNSKAAKKANAEVDALLMNKQAELKKKGEALKNMEKSLKEPGSKVKAEDYNRGIAEYQRMAGVAEAELKTRATELRKGVLDQVRKTIETIGKEEKYAMIFIADAVPHYPPASDITDKVLKKYDEMAEAGAPPEAPAPK